MKLLHKNCYLTSVNTSVSIESTEYSVIMHRITVFIAEFPSRNGGGGGGGGCIYTLIGLQWVYQNKYGFLNIHVCMFGTDLLL